MEEFTYLGSMITNDASGTREIKARIAMAKAAFNRKKTLFISKVVLELRKKLVKCYIWSIASYGAETWTLRKLDQKYLESFEMWRWRRMEKVSWTDRVNNDAVLHRVKEERNILHTISSSSVILTRLSRPRSIPILLRKSDSAGNRTRDLWVCSEVL
jgi:hypothetical protein